MLNNLRQYWRVNIYFVSKYCWLILLLGEVKFLDACSKFVLRFFGATLKGVRLITLGAFLITNFYKNDFAKFTKSCNGAAFTAFPKRLVAFANCGPEFFTRDSSQIFTGNTFCKTVFGGLVITNRKVGNNVFLTFLCLMLSEIKKSSRCSSNNTTISSAKTCSIATSLFNCLSEFGVAYVVLLAFNHSVRVFVLGIAINHKVGIIVWSATRHLYFEVNEFRFILIAIDEFGPKFCTDFFFRIAPSFRVIRNNIVDFLVFAFAGESDVSVCYCLLQICHVYLQLQKSLMEKMALWDGEVCVIKKGTATSCPTEARQSLYRTRKRRPFCHEANEHRLPCVSVQ